MDETNNDDEVERREIVGRADRAAGDEGDDEGAIKGNGK